MANVTSSRTRSRRRRSKDPTSSRNRPQRSRASSNSQKITISGQRSLSGPPRGAQGPATPPVQGPSQRVSGLIGSRGSSPQTPPKAPSGAHRINPSGGGSTSSGGGRRGGSSGIRGTLTAALAGAISTGSLRNPISKAKQREAKKSIGKYNTRDADGTVRSRAKVGPKIVGPEIVGPKKVGTEAQSFDKAFAAARKAGKKIFTWKGKKYNTKVK